MKRLIGSVDKALIALQRLGEVGADGRPLNRLAVDLGINKASLHHTLSVLRFRGFVEQNHKGHYRLGPAALSLSDSYLHDDSFSRMHEALKQLSVTINEICHLGILAGEDIVYVQKVVPRSSINTWSTVGFRNPALTTALGRAIVCQKYVDFDSFASAFPTPISQRTPHTLSSLKDIWLELIEARRRGFAREINEYVMGTSCLSVAVLRGYRPIAAISVTGPTVRLSDQHEQFLLCSLRDHLTPRLPTGLSLQMPAEPGRRGGRPRKVPPSAMVFAKVPGGRRQLVS